MMFLNPHFLLFVSVLGWAGNAIAGKYAVGHISPMVLTFTQWLLAFLILLILFGRSLWLDRFVLMRHWLFLLLLGGLGYTAFNFLLYTALTYTSAINVTIEQTATPLLIFILNFLIFRIGVSAFQIIGYALTFFGVIVTATYGSPLSLLTSFDSLNRGDLLMMIGGLFYAGYCIGLSHSPVFNLTTFLFGLVTGGLVFAFFGVIYEVLYGLAVWPVTSQGIYVLLYTGTVPTLISQGCFVLGVSALGSNRAGLYINLVPVLAALMVVVLLIEPLHLYHLVAFLLVVGGILIAQQGTKTETKP